MDFQAYLDRFEQILNDQAPEAPYDKAAYLDYTRLNGSRMNRWLKKGILSGTLIDVVQRISKPQRWVVITEPWCGDAAHSVPFIELAAQLNPLITVEYELRDSEPYRINEYLTGSSKSIPKLIIQDSGGADLATWGPRPVECQKLFDQLKEENADSETQKKELQHWYNADKGQSVQAELEAILKTL